jgi:hypothetical protein
VPLPKLRSRWFAWWYFSIALGFVLLAVSRALAGERAWPIALRFVIAAGFAALGYLEFHSNRRS